MYHHVNVFVLLLALFVVAGPLLAPLASEGQAQAADGEVAPGIVVGRS